MVHEHAIVSHLLGKMSQISADAKLSAVYTNHCVRATSITRMKSAHFALCQVIRVPHLSKPMIAFHPMI